LITTRTQEESLSEILVAALIQKIKNTESNIKLGISIELCSETVHRTKAQHTTHNTKLGNREYT
jgi:hypothetical protein